MKVYIVTDLEGVAGVYQWENRDDTSLENHERRVRQRRWLAEEVNAMVRGLRASGAEDIWINDGHGAGYTIDIGRVDPGVRIIHGVPRPFYCVGLDETCDALGSLGTHAMAETPGATLWHTMGTGIRGYWLNGIRVGETGYQAFLAGHFGVPFVFCAGEAHACKEMEELCPGCVTVPVKYGLSRTSALTATPARAREMIREGAEEAMKRIKEVEPLKLDPPIIFREEWYEPHFDPENPPPVGRVIDAHTLEIEAQDMVDLMYKKYRYDRAWRPLWRQTQQ
ncbi:MAG: M55 family metallopeptidase [Armatimonadetes bacterium]|nr:M55 family metallopeptidase [Armatimonadota bacterium]